MLDNSIPGDGMYRIYAKEEVNSILMLSDEIL